MSLQPADDGLRVGPEVMPGLLAAILALPRHRDGRQRTSARTPADRRTRHAVEVDDAIEITESNLPRWDEEPES